MPSTDDSSASKASSYPSSYTFLAGSLAGATSRICTAPLDLIRIRRQLSVQQYPQESLLQSWKNIVEHEGGILALFRGNTAAILLWISYTGVQFTVRDRVKDFLHHEDGNNIPPMRTPLSSPTLVSFVAGATAGVCATLLTYPFDVCRTTFAAQGLSKVNQVTDSALSSATTTATTINTSRPTNTTTESSSTSSSTKIRTNIKVPFSSLVEPSYNHPINHSKQKSSTLQMKPPRTLWEFTQQLYKQQGIRGFYAGASPAVLQIVPYMGLTFTIYDHLTSRQQQHNKSVLVSAYAGSIAGGLSKILVFPLDTVKRRLQAQAFYSTTSNSTSDTPYRSMMDCFQRTYQREGITGFYRGVVPSVLKTTLATCISFAVFRSAQNLLESIHNRLY